MLIYSAFSLLLVAAYFWEGKIAVNMNSDVDLKNTVKKGIPSL